jgi:hypothetical protein
MKTRTRAASNLMRLILVTVTATLGVMIAGPIASAAAKSALIDAQTVSGGASSQEAQILTAAGYTVNVVDDSTWATMTASQFGSYDLLVAGDPTCGSLPPGLVSSAPVYGPVVLGHAGGRTAAGNRTVVGTDPVFHDGGDYTSPNARGTIIRDGLAFAGAQTGTTGMYFDTTCAGNYYGQGPETLSILSAISQGSGAWTIDDNPPCGGNVALIASNPAFSDLTTASLQGWECSVHEAFPTFQSDFSALAIATDTTSHPVCGTDKDSGANACGEPYILIAGSAIVVRSGEISLTPSDATNPVGTDHTVTAHVTEGGSPTSGVKVDFSVTGQNAGATGTCNTAGCVTDASGNVTFTYHDTNGAGDDTIKASFTDPGGSLQSATAAKHWVAGDKTPPTCALTGVVAGPPKQIKIGVQDTGSGLGSIVVTSSTNATTPVPPFTVGTTSAVTVTSTKTNQSLGSTVGLKVTDVAGNVTLCDPTLIGLQRNRARAQAVRVRHLAQAESKVVVVNGKPGVHRLRITVNGMVVRRVVMRNRQTETFDVASAMRAGHNNTITMTMQGKKGSTATVAIHD